MEQLGLGALLERLGFNSVDRACAMATIIARMAAPGSERASWRWLCEHSALGELLGVDFECMSMMRLYRVSDALMAKRTAIESHLFAQATELFGLRHTVTLYDLTNTFYEGSAATHPKAKRGHSKEKRSDCPLLTLGLVLDGSGFVRRSEVFSGAVNEAGTLAGMLDGDLAGEDGATPGIAIVEDFEEVVTALAREGSEPPVIQDEEPDLGESLDEPGIGAVAPGEGELVEETGEAEVAGRDPVSAGLVAESTGDEGFSGPGRTCDQDRLAVEDPLTGSEAEDDRSVQTAAGLEVEVFDGGVEVELGVALEPLISALLPVGLLAFEEQGEAVVEGELADVGHGGLFLEGLSHAREAEFVEEVEGGMSQHDRQFSLSLKWLA